jgi:sterol desaturase/sphingolipid hydroxylase (fatty acid hydroxylase superfamily)
VPAALAGWVDLIVRPLVFVALAGAAFVPLEWVLSERRRGTAARRGALRAGFATDLAFASLGQIATAAGLALGAGWTLAWLEPVAIEAPLSAVASPTLRSALEVALGLLLFELGGYAYHRLAHRVPLLWRLHEVHHSAETLDWLASFRQHPLEIVLMTLAQNAPLVLLGIPLGTHALVLLLIKLNTVFVHADVAVPHGPWSSVWATPRYHHRHHQRDGEPCNFASLFPFIDRLFGTHSAERGGRPGLPHALPQRFAALLLHPVLGRPTSRR